MCLFDSVGFVDLVSSLDTYGIRPLISLDRVVVVRYVRLVALGGVLSLDILVQVPSLFTMIVVRHYWPP